MEREAGGDHHDTSILARDGKVRAWVVVDAEKEMEKEGWGGRERSINETMQSQPDAGETPSEAALKREVGVEE